MDWNIGSPIIFAIATAAGLLWAVRSQKRDAPRKVEELWHHLEQLGVKAYPVENDSTLEKGEG